MSTFEASMLERWLEVASHPDYEVSDLGRVRRKTGGKGVRAGRVLRACVQPNGYAVVNLYRQGIPRKRTVHSLVMAAFVGPRPIGSEVNHRDGDKSNNALINLHYCTGQENKAHAAATGLSPYGHRNRATRLTDEQVSMIRAAGAAGASQRAVAQLFSISQRHVSDILRGKRRRERAEAMPR